MKNKAPLALIELTVMILIFSLAAALCLQAFAWSDLTSAEISRRDRAVLQAEMAAEVIKSCGGDFEEAAGLLQGTCSRKGSLLTVHFDGDCLLEAVKEDSGTPLLGAADVSVMDDSGERLFSIRVCWQEVEGNEG